jgi:hypothetical protein
MKKFLTRHRKNLQVKINTINALDSKVGNIIHSKLPDTSAGDVAFKTCKLLPNISKSLTLARMWMGECMKYTDQENPYAKHDGNRKTVADIAPTADMPDGDSPALPETVDELIQYLDELREYCKDTINAFHWGMDNAINNFSGTEFSKGTIWAVEQHLKEARMWAGQALGAIRDGMGHQAPSETTQERVQEDPAYKDPKDWNQR